MNAVEITITLVALVALATGLGVAWKKLTGRARRITATNGETAIDLRQFPGSPQLGEKATLLQFSTEMCSPCRQTHTILATISAERSAIAHVDIDLTHRADLANRFNILQTPTTLILDSDGAIRARIGGAVTRSTVTAELDNLLAITP